MDIQKIGVPMIVHITGNECASYFGVSTLDEDNELIDLLVNTVDPYYGVVIMDLGDKWTKRMKVEASCAWTIEIRSLFSARSLDVPGTIEGTGDDVLQVTGETPDLVFITGNDCGSYFGVTAYGRQVDLLVNTVDPYDGTGIVNAEAMIVVVQASCPWTIEITAK